MHTNLHDARDARASDGPQLAMGMMVAPFNLAKRWLVRSTMLSGGPVQRGEVVFRFVVGLEALPRGESDQLRGEAANYSDVLLLEQAR